MAAAEELGAALATAGHGLVYGGGRAGLMGAVADGVLKGGGHVTGVIPQALMDLEVGHTGIPDLRVVGTMHERKALMYELSSVFITLPGGIGTFEEFFETVTWNKLGLHKKPSLVLNVAGYYDPLRDLLDHSLRSDFITADVRGLMRIVDSVPETMAVLDELFT